MTIVESTRPITGGVDTHLDVHVAAALDRNGGVLGVESFPTTPPATGICTAGWPASVISNASGWRAPAPTARGWPGSCSAPGWR